MANMKVFFGLVAEDRALTSRVIKVFVKEMSPYASGALGDNTGKEAYTIQDGSGKSTSGSVTTTNTVTAEYLDMTSNRVFPPDVVKGEQVLLLQYADSDIYYWISLGRDDNLRRGELMRLAVSDDMAKVKSLTDANTYFIELDSKISKRIRLSTCKSDGEAFAYELTFDSKNNSITLGDDQGNQFTLLSDTPRITMKNKSGTVVDLNDTNIVMIAPADMLIRADGSMTIKTPSLTVVADSITVSAGSVNVGGENGGSGTVAIKGPVSMDGSAAISQGLTVGGSVTVAGSVTAGAFNS